MRSAERKRVLSALWTSVMFCYAYGDVFGFFKPGVLADIIAGRTGAFGTQGGLLAAAVFISVPSVMIALSLLLAPHVDRYVNGILGVLYTAAILATMPGTWAFYLYLGVVEAALTLTIAWLAWRWPEEA